MPTTTRNVSMAGIAGRLPRNRRRVRLAAAAVAVLAIIQVLVVWDSSHVGAQTETSSEGAPDASSEPATSSLLDVHIEGTASRFGSVEAIGDVNGDGIADLAVGAYSDDGAGEDVGAAYVLLMAGDGTIASQHRITAGQNGFDGELVAGGAFGFRIAGPGDIDADGVPDVVVSAYRSNRAGEDTGEIWVLFLNADASVKRGQVLTDGYGALALGLHDGDEFGVDVAAAGDIDKDGVGDLAVGVWRRDGAAGDEGGIALITLTPEGKAKATVEFSAISGWPTALAADEGFGVSVDVIGDLDNDGVDDLIIGAANANSETGLAYVAFMTADSTVRSTVAIEPGTAAVPALGEGARFGASVAGLGDLDGDGHPEVAVGAFGVGDAAGAAWVFTLDIDGTVTDSRPLTPATVSPGDLFGHTIASVGDIDGDGAADVAIGAPGSDSAGLDQGAVHIVRVGPPAPVVDPDDLDGDGIPNETEGRGDLDGDGRPNHRDRDADGDGVADRGEAGLDSDEDGKPDFLDPDDDNDGIPTAVEGRRDPDVDEIPNHLDLDSDGDGINDSIEGSGDADNDGIPNYLDLDSDNDGVLDADETVGDADQDGTPDSVDRDSDNDGIRDGAEGVADADGDGVPNTADLDSDGDGIADADEGRKDSDGDGAPDRIDLDSDGDSIGDRAEGTGDTDGDGTPDYLDTDSDGDGIPDADEGRKDSDGDGVRDALDADSDDDGIPDADEGRLDTDGDGVPNAIDVDSDGDGRPDSEEGTVDVDSDGVPDYLDGRSLRARVGVEVTAPNSLVAGKMNEIVLAVGNAGPDPASVTEATITVPAGVQVDRASLPDDCGLVGDELTCLFGPLGVSESASRSIRAQLSPGVTGVELAASVLSPEGRAVGSSGPIAVLEAGLDVRDDGLGSARGALIVMVLVAIVCGGAILAMTRDSSEPLE